MSSATTPPTAGESTPADDSTQIAESKAPDTTARAPRTPLVRVVLVLAALFTAWHIFATFLWIAPPSGLRQAIPGNLLQRYMIPLHGQSWSVFAPEPINGDHRLQVRAIVLENGQPRTTEWVDATRAEISMLQHNLLPPRAAIQSTELASTFKGAYDKLPSESKKIAALGYFKEDWEARLQAEVRRNGTGSVTTKYLDAEHEVTAYATQVAYAVWGDDVQQVQFVVSRQNVIPFAQRNDPNAKRPPVQVATTGWRGLVEEPGQDRENFARTFRRALKESGQ